jgi:thiol-disulfide isomerase/thioredoxin
MPGVDRLNLHRKGIGMTQLSAFRWLLVLAVVLIGLVTPTFGSDGSVDGPSLTIGSVAPNLDIENWIQTGNGAFEPVTTFANDHVYVVEFWATWCGPCVASMPHLAALQGEYADKQVQIISITAEDLATVEAFLDRKVRGEEDKTYRELTAAYCLTSDPDRSCDADYMKAAQQRGIPTAFIVGKDGHIEWIGHPMSMDEPLKSIVNSTWDREQFAIELEHRKVIEQAFNEGMTGDAVAAIERLKELAATTELESVKNTCQLGIDQLEMKRKMDALKDSLKSTEPNLAELERQLAEADTRQLFWLVGQVGQLLTKEPRAVAKYHEVVSTMLDSLEKKFDGDGEDQMLSQIYANAARLAASPEQAASRIESFLKTYDGPAAPLLKHVADSFRKSTATDEDKAETKTP